MKAGFKVSSYTFGTPRFANQQYRDFMNARFDDVYFFVNHQDFIAHVPYFRLSNLWQTYANNCPEVYFDREGNMSECSCAQGLERCSDQWPVYMLSVSDHSEYFGVCICSHCGYCPGDVGLSWNVQETPNMYQKYNPMRAVYNLFIN